MTAISVLDLVPIAEGQNYADSLANSLMLAQQAEAYGYQRYWVAEHHNIAGIGSAATALVISHLAAGTRTIRVGAGGIMLPNHAPLIIAEQFGTLATLYSGRIDLGLGRAPGSDGLTARAMRRGMGGADNFPQDVVELMDYLADNGRQQVKALPGPHDIPIWILGSSLYGAQLAAAMGLPYAFASHFAPTDLIQALAIYRATFKPSRQLQQPYVMAGVNVFAADTRQEAEFLASSHQQWAISLYAGNPGLLPKPVAAYMASLPPAMRSGLEARMQYTALGSRAEVGAWLRHFIAQTGVDELMVSALIRDPRARCRSYQLAAESIQLAG